MGSLFYLIVSFELMALHINLIASFQLRCNYIYEINKENAHMSFYQDSSKDKNDKYCTMLFIPRIYNFTKIRFIKANINGFFSQCHGFYTLTIKSHCDCDISAYNMNPKEFYDTCQTKFSFCTDNLQTKPILYMTSCFAIDVTFGTNYTTLKCDKNNTSKLNDSLHIFEVTTSPENVTTSTPISIPKNEDENNLFFGDFYIKSTENIRMQPIKKAIYATKMDDESDSSVSSPYIINFTVEIEQIDQLTTVDKNLILFNVDKKKSIDVFNLIFDNQSDILTGYFFYYVSGSVSLNTCSNVTPNGLLSVEFIQQYNNNSLNDLPFTTICGFNNNGYQIVEWENFSMKISMGYLTKSNNTFKNGNALVNSGNNRLSMIYPYYAAIGYFPYTVFTENKVVKSTNRIATTVSVIVAVIIMVSIVGVFLYRKRELFLCGSGNGVSGGNYAINLHESN